MSIQFAVIFLVTTTVMIQVYSDACNDLCKQYPGECNRNSGSWCKGRAARQGICHGIYVEESQRGFCFSNTPIANTQCKRDTPLPCPSQQTIPTRTTTTAVPTTTTAAAAAVMPPVLQSEPSLDMSSIVASPVDDDFSLRSVQPPISPCQLVTSTSGSSFHVSTFLAFGDFGLNNHHLFVLAQSLRRQLLVRSPPAAVQLVGLGDNFYPNGVTSIDDPQWTGFSDVLAFTGSSPFNMLIGNHDYNGNVTAQIDYTNTNPLWHFPSLNYVEMYRSAAGAVCALYIDTVHLDVEWIHRELSKPLCNGADWKIIFGHYPVYTVGQYHKSRTLNKFRPRILPILNMYQVDAYISGHDHSHQILYEADGSRVYVVSGCTVKYENRREPRNTSLSDNVLMHSYRERITGYTKITIRSQTEMDIDIIEANHDSAIQSYRHVKGRPRHE